MWSDTPFSKRLGIRYPIVQGPFGGGPSSVRLLSAVSNAGGMGSYGMHMVEPQKMRELASEIRLSTDKPFALNLWISNSPVHPHGEASIFQAGVRLLKSYYTELGIALPQIPERYLPNQTEQLEALLEIAPPVASFVYGIPPAAYLERCRRVGIVTMGTATTPEEAKALEDAGIDVIVASGPEAGGHRGSFVRSPEESLIGMFALIPQIADTVKVPFIAAGGIADARGVAAALALGAQGVQMGTAFLACDESDAGTLHRAALWSPAARRTTLTRAFTGRLARSIPNQLSEALDHRDADIPPYPLQAWLVGKLKPQALGSERSDLLSFSAGQAAGLIRHRNACDLIEAIVAETPGLLQRLNA